MKSIKQLAVAGLFVGLLSFANPAAAFQCGQSINDDAGLLKGNVSEVTDSLTALQEVGVQAFVITVPNHRSANLDHYIQGVKDSCPAFQSPDGKIKNNLVILVVEKAHREVGLYYGNLWDSALDESWLPIKNRMIPRLGDGDFSDAFTYALDDIRQAVKVDLEPPPPVAAGPTTIVQQEPVDLSGLWRVLAWILGIVFVVILAFITLRAWRSHQARLQERRTAQRKAQVAKTTCVNLINGMQDPLVLLDAAVSKAANAVLAEDAQQLRDSHKLLQANWNGLTSEFGELNEIAANDPKSNDLTVDDYDRIADLYDSLRPRLKAQVEEVTELRNQANVLFLSGVIAAEEIIKAEAQIAAATLTIEAVSGKGFKTDVPRGTALRSADRLDAAHKAVEERRYLTAINAAQEAAQIANDAAAEATGCETQKEELDLIVVDLSARIPQLQGMLETTRPMFDELQAEYLKSSWVHVAGNGTEAQNRIHAATEVVAQAQQAASMDMQDWTEAQSQLNRARTLLDEAEALLVSIRKLSIGLAEAKLKAQAEIDAAQADIDQAHDYMSSHADTVSTGLTISLADASKVLAQARAELAQAKPDYVLVVKRALEANTAADEILAEAISQHEALQRKRRQADSFAEEARRSLKTAASYINNHRSDIGGGALRSLTRAQELVTAISLAQNLDQQIDAARKADEVADNALAQAQRDFSSAEDSRESQRQAEAAAQRRREDTFNTSTTTTWGTPTSGGFDSGFGGGSSTFGGGGDTFGGGSSNW